jgi:hypothetical protein
VPLPGDSPGPLLVRHRQSGGTHVAVRRVAGVHRPAGMAGPTRRYMVIVVMLATMSSLPIIAAISAGSANVGESVDASGTTPFIAPPSEGPVVVPPPPPPALPAEVPVPAGVAEQLRAVAPKREPRQRHPVRKLKRPVRDTESAPAPTPSQPVEPTKPPASPSPSPTPSPQPPVIPWPPLPSGPYLPLPPSAIQSAGPSVVPPTGLPTCWPDLDACLSDPGASVRP